VRVLAGDIGGTKTAVAIIEIDKRRLGIVRSQKYPSREFASLERVLEDFLHGQRRIPAVAAFGVAGPVRSGRAKVTKLPWVIDERRVSRAAGISRVRVLNDFVAAALGIAYVTPRHVVALARGRAERNGPIGVIGAGTGLGQAGLLAIGERLEVFASEGGHADFGTRTPTEDGLLRFVRRRFGRVSRDRLLSGGGLTLIYEFLRSESAAEESHRVARELQSEDPASVISRHGLDGDDSLCSKALALFASIYGSEAGNLALQYRATGGVYLAGGIAARILPVLRTAVFLDAFRKKAPMEDLLSNIPVRVVTDPRVGLYGAAAAAYRTAMETTRPS
jgi:glucokinase